MSRFSSPTLSHRMSLLAIGVIALPAMILDAAAQEEDDEGYEALEEIVVTGSRIKRRDFISSSPLTTIDQTTI